MGVPIGKQRPKEMAKPKCLCGCGRVNQGRKLWEQCTGRLEEIWSYFNKVHLCSSFLASASCLWWQQVSFVLVQGGHLPQGSFISCSPKGKGGNQSVPFLTEVFQVCLELKTILMPKRPIWGWHSLPHVTPVCSSQTLLWIEIQGLSREWH